jgi:hypothetical protein
MRFMVLVKASQDTEAGVMPSTELLAAMGRYNEQLAKAGVLLAGEGLHPSAKGARVRFSGRIGKWSAVPSAGRGISWPASGCSRPRRWTRRSSGSRAAPTPTGAEGEIEIRPVFEADDFGPALTPELREQEDRLRAQRLSRSSSSHRHASTRIGSFKPHLRNQHGHVEHDPSERRRRTAGPRRRGALPDGRRAAAAADFYKRAFGAEEVPATPRTSRAGPCTCTSTSTRLRDAERRLPEYGHPLARRRASTCSCRWTTSTRGGAARSRRGWIVMPLAVMFWGDR